MPYLEYTCTDVSILGLSILQLRVRRRKMCFTFSFKVVIRYLLDPITGLAYFDMFLTAASIELNRRKRLRQRRAGSGNASGIV